MTDINNIEIAKEVIRDNYEKELTESQEAVVGAVIKDLKDTGVTDEVIKGRVLAQHKSFALKCYVAAVNARNSTEESTEEVEGDSEESSE